MTAPRMTKTEAWVADLDTEKPPRRQGKRVKHAPREGRHVLFEQLCKAHGLPIPDCEVEFIPGRKFRADYLFEGWLILEVQGGLFVGGRHVRGPALKSEYEKLNLGVIHGYSFLFCLPEQIQDGGIFPIIRAALEGGEEQQS